jgi:N-acetyl-alpha-D-glucosaminyl L-malate synthase BshA
VRIAIVCYPTYGGSGVVASEQALALASRGHDVHLVSYEAPFRIDRWLPNLRYHAVDSSQYPLFRYPHYTLNLTNKLIEVVEQHGVEIIHSHYAIPHAIAAKMAREVLRSEKNLDVKLACTLHGTDITLVGLEQGYYELTRYAIRQQDLLTTPSDWLARETATHFHTNGDVQVIPNFVDLARFAPKRDCQARSQLAPKGWRIITHASNFRPVKRVEEVVGAFATLRRSIPAVLVLAGDGPDLPKAEALARELGVRDDLRLLGQQAQIETVLQASDLFLLPSRAESFGLAALEAMATGCPVLGYHAGGLPEVVEDGVSGILCPEGSDACLGSLAARLLQDEPRYQSMRAAARARAEQFDVAKVIDRYESSLQALLGTPRSP